MITIIVLLILAGVTIATLTGENGLLQKAVDSKTNTDNAKISEQIRLAHSAAIIAGNGTLTEENLNIELAKQFGSKDEGYIIKDNDEGTKWIVTVNEVEETIDKPKELITPTERKLADVVKIGDYVNYNAGGQTWRVCYVDKTNGVVRLVTQNAVEESVFTSNSLLDNTVATSIKLMDFDDMKDMCEQSDNIEHEIKTQQQQWGSPGAYELRTSIYMLVWKDEDNMITENKYNLNSYGYDNYYGTYNMYCVNNDFTNGGGDYGNCGCIIECFDYGPVCDVYRIIANLNNNIKFTTGNGSESSPYNIY